MTKSKITAVLGPTNTGKTHLAIETMLSFENGMIGFPLRLLAREVYDKVIKKIGLDKVAFDNFVKFHKKYHKIEKKIKFQHGKKYKLSDGKILLASYHPSPRNVNTGRINKIKMVNLLRKVKKDLDK